ncbi:CRE-SRW-96 protein [Caenorhabditis remanei]|uniref:CRE-SRW-96 protein n=1 Tax=Caenorhabditis remanei TaxID=31234 RepID=E3LLF8_CAERE|nr:CRE-SRW-96 protein [Caenorhabditis remanei]
MTSSVITIMLGIACFDMTSMLITIGTNNMLYGTEGSECSPPATLLSFKVFWFFIAIRDLVRRSSTWLGVLMAFIRFVGLKFGTQPIFQRLARPVFGCYAIICSIVLSFILSVFYWLRYDFVDSDTDTWKPSNGCPNYSPTDIRPIVSQKPSKLFTDYDGVVGKVFMLINGSISKIIPCLLLPLLTILLTFELQHAKEVRKSLIVPVKDNSTERTTILVIFMTLSFFIAELPIGTALALQVAYTDIGFLFLATFVTHMCNALFTINSVTHCLVFFIMSSQYRKTVQTYIGIPRQTLETTTRSTVFSISKKRSI